MSQLTDEQLQNTNSVIANGLEAKTMRHKIENKDLLSQKGALYVGTGNTTSTGAAVTTSIAPNSETDDGKVLIADSAKLEGWKIDKIGNDSITNGAITGDKLAENFTYITSDTSSFCLQDSSNNSTPRLSFVESNNHASVALQADLKSQELEGKSYTLKLPNENGTVATKEQIESGEIVAKTAQNATNATNAENTDFTNAEWSDSVESATLTAGLYQILIASTYTYLFHYDGRTTIGNAGGDIISLTASSPSAPEQIYITTRTPSVSNSVLTISAKVYTISTNGFALYNSGNEHFKYRKIR